MASLDILKGLDGHQVAEALGLTRPQVKGNYNSPHHEDKTPSLSIYQKNGVWAFKDFSDETSDAARGSNIDLVMYVEDIDVAAACKRLHELFGLPFDKPNNPEPQQQEPLHQFIARQCLKSAEKAKSYLIDDRGISKQVVDDAINNGSIGFNTWTSPKIAQGEFGYGGPAAAFIVKTLNPGSVVAVDMRYIEPENNGGVKTQTQGDKAGHVWTSDISRLRNAETVYLVESAINALSIETAMPSKKIAAAAIRGTGNIDNIDWRFLFGKKVVICMDNDEATKQGVFPGQYASWKLYDELTSLNIAAMLIDQEEWEVNDVNDYLQEKGQEECKYMLYKLQPWVIQGMPGNYDADRPQAKRMYLPAHDYSKYWKYRAKEDFTTYINKVVKEDGDPDSGDGKTDKKIYSDLCGFRVAALTRITIASASSVMTGDIDHAPRTLFAISAQVPRHGYKLLRRVFEDEHLHNPDRWKRLGPVFNLSAFLRMVSMLERSAHLGARDAINFVGVAWRDGRMVVNQGPDCYFTDPDKQCPYADLVFPSGTTADARQVIQAYQATFKKNAAAIPLIWGLGGHLKAIMHFWPHFMLQADKGAGKSVLVHRMERTLGFKMLSGQSTETAFRLMTSLSHTSQPVGWEEISARDQKTIDKAMALLQEAYNYTETSRGSEMTKYLISAPVMLAGEDVPADTLLGKLVMSDLTGKKGDLMPDNLPVFPVLQWCEYITTLNKTRVMQLHASTKERLIEACSGTRDDDGALRMVENYAAVLVAWKLICDFAQIDPEQGDFGKDLVAVMNHEVMATKASRQPWVWIMETVLSEIDAKKFNHPYAWAEQNSSEFELGNGVMCLLIRTSHIMDHIAHTPALREKFNALPVKSNKAFRRQLQRSGVIFKEQVEKNIGGRRISNLVAIDIKKLEQFGLWASPTDNDKD